MSSVERDVRNGVVASMADEEALRLRETSLRAVEHFATPVELYVVDGDGELQEFGNEIQRGCLVQAWSAAAVLDWVSFVQVEAANISAASAEAA